MASVEATRWVLEHIDRARNMNRFYIIYVVPESDDASATEIRHWGRRGTSGRYDTFLHATVEQAVEAASQKAYAELGKGYKQIAHDTFPVESRPLTPTVLDAAAKRHGKRVAEMGLTDSEIDQFTRAAQTLMVALQDPTTGIDIDKVGEIKARFHALTEQFGRASTTMKMVDMLCAARLEKVGA